MHSQATVTNSSVLLCRLLNVDAVCQRKARTSLPARKDIDVSMLLRITRMVIGIRIRISLISRNKLNKHGFGL